MNNKKNINGFVVVQKGVSVHWDEYKGWQKIISSTRMEDWSKITEEEARVLLQECGKNRASKILADREANKRWLSQGLVDIDLDSTDEDDYLASL